MDPNRLFEHGIGGSPGWGMPPYMAADRRERWHRIGPILPTLRDGVIPVNIPVNLLEKLLGDIKEEGNACFKDKDYNVAYEMYTSALHVCKNLQTVHFVNIDNELLSTIFSNRAACLLKMDFYRESIQDCDIAIQQNCDNIKAYYRMAVAYKSLRDYSCALQSARKGRQQASNAKKIKEVKEFDDLICEVDSHLPSPENVTADKSDEMNKHSSKGKAVENSGEKIQQMSISKAGVSNDFKVIQSKSKDNIKMEEKDVSKVDNKNFGKEKPAIVKKKAENITKKKVKKKVVQKKSQYQGKYAMLSNDGSFSEESDEAAQFEMEEDVNRDNANNSESVDHSNLPTEMAMGLDDFQDITSHVSGRRAVNVNEVSRGLSTFPHPESGHINKQHDYPFTTVSYQQPVVKVTTQSPQNSFLGDFICLNTKFSNEFPFDRNYDLALACDQCYVQTGFGQAGYQCLGMLPHKCDYSVFLIRPKPNPEVGWFKIRPRNQKVKFIGPFKICWEYSSGLRCRVSEMDCSFAHNAEECRLWTLDRENLFDLTMFVSNLRLSTNRSSDRSLDIQQQQQHGKIFTNSAYGISMDYDAVLLQSQKDAAKRQFDHKNIPEVVSFGRKTTSKGFEPMFSNVVADSRVQQDLKKRLGPEPISWAEAASGKGQLGNDHVFQNEEVHQSYRIPFPLTLLCDFHLVCNQCFLPLSQYGECFWWNPGLRHRCEENILAVQRKGVNFWVRIRERINHREFRGNYVLCRHYESGKPNACRRAEKCLFAHNYEEQHLWTMEKDGSFDIAEFIRQNRSQSAAPLFSVYGMLEKYPGELRHLCGACYRGSHLLSGQSHADATKCSSGQHVWHESKMLIHFSANGVITEIGQRGFRSKNAYFKLCHHQKFCFMKNNGKCVYAHSLIERDVWCLERDQDLTEDQIVEEAMKINSQKYFAGLPKPSSLDEQKQLPSTSYQAVPVPVPLSEQHVPSDAANSSTKCPYHVIEVCKLCFEKGAISRCKKDRCDGPGMGHIWSQNKLVLILPSKKKLSPLPKTIPKNLNFVICRHMLQKKRCDFVPAGQCQFAHSKEEIAVWTWMVCNNAKTLEELLLASQKTYETSETKTISKGQSVVAISRAVPIALPQPKPYASPLDLALNTHYCHYCSVHCNSQKQWDEHCASDKHMFNVNSDKEHQWNYRQPPWGIGGCNYELCDKHADGGKCSFSEVPDMYNQCKFAHSQEELDEWKERWEWRQMKREIAKKEHLYSYMAALREDYEMTDAGVSVINDEIEEVLVKCSSNLNIFEQKKNTVHSWFFEIHAGRCKLHKVALLYDRDRLHFTLHGENIEKDCQIAPGESFIKSNSAKSNIYNVEVRFSSGIFGSFSQWVIFDFNDRPVLVRKVNAELGTQFVQEKVKALREKLKFDRWTSDNREIVWFDDRAKDTSDHNSEVLQSYKAPSSADSVVTQQTVGVELNRHNYVHKMHKLLQIEELTQAHIMSRFNLQVEIRLMQRIDENGFVNARCGELFACVPLTDHLNEDTDAGCLILSGVSTVLLAPLESSDRIVYEAIFVQKENFDYNGRGSDHIYLCLSKRCCEALKLRNDDSVEVEMQFQLNRLTFCQMHYAVDQLPSTELVFPDISRVSQTNDDESPYKLSSSVLNEDQLKIIQYIVTQKHGYNPPLVIYGPFGTGKTETLAQAAMTLSSIENTARILICTHSNSAADLYILRHFDAFIKQSSPGLKILRIYAKERRTNTVKPLVQKHCLMSDDRSYFLEPTRSDVLDHKVVITTLVTSLTLTRKHLNLRGCFTHIFIDEAAQVFECETIMPLSLATDSTTIVLAGDYHQMAQKVYSKEAKRQRFHRSLVHRLFEHYKTYAHVSGGSLPNVLLKNNYRTKMEILRFLAAVFYGGPDRLIACSNQLPVDDVVPLSFYTAFGREIQDRDSTSYYNLAEIEEVVERVSELYNNWPKDWNEPIAESILVVTPYLDQVLKIRSALKKKSRELGRLSVDRVSNVQGTEFRAVFISTVRTQHLAEASPRVPTNASECDGEFGDFGFLSDAKLLNTAFTRARSIVTVVGDPVALCAIGECMTVWRTYLKHCQNMKSIHPSTVTLDTIKARVQSLLNSPVSGPNLQRLSVLHQEAASGKFKPDKNVASDLDTEFSSLKPDPNPFESITLNGIFKDWSLDYQTEPDIIIKHLMKEVVLQRSDERRQRAEKQGEPFRSDCTRLVEKKGHAMIQFTSVGSKEASNSGDNRRGYESSASDDEDDGNMSTVAHVDYMPQQLKEMIHRQPERFKHCVLKVVNSHSMYARSLNSACSQIKISSRSRCGQAFANDEVVVEIFPSDAEDAAALCEDQQQIPCGQVIGVLKRAINPKHRMFICMVQEDNTGCMIPINRSIPKIYNLEQPQKTKRGHVCVYTFTRDKEPIFHHFEPVDSLNSCSKLFIVRYLKWETNFSAPVGIVVGVLSAGATVEQTMRVLNIEHYVPTQFKEDTVKEIATLFPTSFQFPSSEVFNRLDYRRKLTFTVDSLGSKYLDNAISIEDLSNGCFLIGVHVSDVTYFVRKGGCVDKEAEERGLTVYPFASDPIQMLHDRLSSDLCSLLPGKDRLTLSVFITIDAKASILNVQIKRSVICSKYHLDYVQLEAVIKHRSPGQDLPENVRINALMLNRVAQIWRRRRLGTAAVYHDMHSSAVDAAAEAHVMIEELLITADHHVARQLMNKYPLHTPLYCQFPPDALELDAWRRKFIEEAKNTVALTRPFRDNGEVCNCMVDCRCIPETTEDLVLVDIQKSTWEDIKSAIVEDDYDRLASLVVCPENHPQMTLAMLQLYHVSNQSQYVCSGDVPHDQQTHYSHNMSVFTHFTLPTRRYMDIVVHRLIKSCLDEQHINYSPSEMSVLCNSCTEVTLNARHYEEATEMLHYARVFQDRPAVLFPIIERLGDELQLRFPLLKVLPRQQSIIKLSSLKVCEKSLSEENRQLTLKWSVRIYDLKAKSEQPSKASTDAFVLNGNKYILQTTASDWRELLWSVISSDKDKILTSLMQVDELLVDSSQDDHFASDVTSEGSIVSSGQQFSHFCLTLYSGSVVQVQVTSDLVKGIMVPSIQLFNLTPTLNICLEHRVNAIKCFAETATHLTARKSYRSVEAYLATWLPVLTVEAAHNAVLNDDSVVIHNVDIFWQAQTLPAGKAFLGTFDIPIHVCKSRQLKFKITKENGKDEKLKEENNSIFQLCHGYLCVQYHKILTNEPNLEAQVSKVSDLSAMPATWVGHCTVLNVGLSPNMQFYTIELQLQQSSCPIPSEILQSSSLQKPIAATVEWIFKPLLFRRMQDAVFGLRKSNELSVNIALGKNPQNLDEAYLSTVDQLKSFQVSYFPELNQGQEEAIKQALHQPFTLIQGPPGTGKTVIGAQLAYLFALINRKLPSTYKVNSIHPQILCCGPSDKSVNILARCLIQLKEQCPKLVRVYSKSLERDEFPLPYDLVQQKKRLNTDTISDDLKSISLHHKIRRNGGSVSDFILQIDEQIRSDPNSVNFKDLENYLEAIAKAEMEIFKEAEIILCTCSTGGGLRVKNGTNIQQLVIDDSGLCMELEALISIVSSEAEQVVLLGDHIQMQPTVLENSSCNQGLRQSLFERYVGKAIRLTTQYRMHESIAEFPSKFFYDGHLTVGKDDQTKASALKFWPNDRRKPLAFVHVMGVEQAMTVLTAKGNEHSQTNAKEVDAAVRTASLLVRRFHVLPQCVAVLSLYHAQCLEIENELLKRGEKDITVSTVAAAQGSEWDFVILSTVRSLPKASIEQKPSKGWKNRHLGLLTDAQQTNIALTRARKGLIIIGNKYLLYADKIWKKLLHHYEAEKKIIDVAEFMA